MFIRASITEHVQPICVLFILSLVPFYKLLFTYGVFALHEWGFPSTTGELWSYFYRTSYAWDLKNGAPRSDTLLGPVYSITVAPFVTLSLPAAWWYVTFTFFAATTMYSLVFSITTRRVAAIISGVAYSYGHFMANNILAGFIGFVIIQAVAPIFVFAIIRGIRRTSPLLTVTSGFVLGLAAAVSLTYAAMLLMILVLWALFVLLTGHGEETLKRRIMHVVPFCSLVVLLAAGLNASWILPSLGVYSGTGVLRPDLASHISQEELTLWSSFNPPLKALLDLAPSDFWYLIVGSHFETISVFASAILVGASMIPIAVRPNRIVALFSTLSVLSLLLGSGANGPTGNLYSWLYLNFVPFAVFNRPYYFQGISDLAISVLLGIAVSLLYTRSSHGAN